MQMMVVGQDHEKGTKVIWWEGGKDHSLGFSTGWNVRSNPPDGMDANGKPTWKGCGSSIDKIVVADTLAQANLDKKKVDLTQPKDVASSSFSSTNVKMIQFGSGGAQTETKVEYLLVAKWHRPDGGGIPIADEIWMSHEPFPDQELVRKAEKTCSEQDHPEGNG